MLRYAGSVPCYGVMPGSVGRDARYLRQRHRFRHHGLAAAGVALKAVLDIRFNGVCSGLCKGDYRYAVALAPFYRHALVIAAEAAFAGIVEHGLRHFHINGRAGKRILRQCEVNVQQIHNGYSRVDCYSAGCEGDLLHSRLVPLRRYLAVALVCNQSSAVKLIAER